MKELVLDKKNFPAFFKALKEAHTVYAREFSDHIPLYKEVDNVEQILTGFSTPGNSQKSPKHVLFPQAETLYKYTKEGEDVHIEPVKEKAEKNVIFGIRSCDARAFLMLDEVFLADPVDTGYKRRRDGTTLIGLACNQPAPNCFCLSVEGGPHALQGLDIMMTDIGDKYFVEVITDKGRELIKHSADLFVEPIAVDRRKRIHAKRKAEEGMMRKLDFKAATEAMDVSFKSEFWDEIIKKCLGCGSCTFVCPTCHCFNITDARGKRTRTWDSCQYAVYTVHTSSHNPRPDKKSRFRNRLYHKFKYMPDAMGHIGCVGCGRCVSLCGVHLDLIEVLDKLVETRKMEGEVKE